MMRVAVTMSGALRRFLPDGRAAMHLDVPEGTTALQVVHQLHAEHDVWLAAIDNRVVPLSAPLSDGCAVTFYPILEGG